MARRRRAEIRKILPDPRHNSVDLAKFINSVMQNGKKTVAQRIVYTALEIAEEEGGRPGIEIFEQEIRKATPVLEVRAQRVDEGKYPVPTKVRWTLGREMAMR